LVLSIFLVNVADDAADGLCDAAHCSLRGAIVAANANAGADEIHFAVPGAGVPTIPLADELPTVTDPVTIDGTTQPAGLVELDGSGAGAGRDGLVIVAGDSTVRGLVINQFDGRGVVLARHGGNRIEGNRIGTDVAGAMDRGNGSHGVLVLDTANNTIGGTSAGSRNVISGNGGDGVQIYGTGLSELATLDLATIQDGRITDPDGDSQVALDGRNATITVPGTAHDLSAEIGLVNAPRVLLSVLYDFVAEATVAGVVRAAGDPTHPERIPFNGAGILLWHDEANYVRLERAAHVRDGTLVTYALFEVREAGQVTVAQTRGLSDQTTFLRLTRHGNHLLAIVNQGDSLWDAFDPIAMPFPADMQVGVDAVSTASEPFTAELRDFRLLQIAPDLAAANVIAGNLVGTDITGTVDIGNTGRGVAIRGSDGNTVGGSAAGVRNVVSGNDSDGVYISDGAMNSAVRGNLIGTNATGSGLLPNSQWGVVVLGAAQSNVIGTDGDRNSDAAERNLISGNLWGGIGLLQAGTDRNAVAGNYIGTDLTGATALGNGNRGVDVFAGAKSNVVVGNVISGNGWEGVGINGAGTDENVVVGNLIGTNHDGSAAVANTLSGVVVFGGASHNTIGGATTEARNIISGNTEFGVALFDTSTDNVIQGNFIGTDVTGAVDLGNGRDGITSQGSPGNEIDYNLISGNDGAGIWFAGETAEGNRVLGNFVLGNGTTGVAIQDAPRNKIGVILGATAGGASNVISGNGVAGIDIYGVAAIGNVVFGNFIGTDATGTAAMGNRVFGVKVAADSNVIDLNLISGNDGEGIRISGDGNTVQDNRIGTDVSGTLPLGNFLQGVVVQGPNNLILRNVISANEAGILIEEPGSTGNLIKGNLIGTDSTGTQPLGNRSLGVRLISSSNTIGGSEPGARNVISANGIWGVYVLSTELQTAENNLIQGNYIGTDTTGTLALGNREGVVIEDSPNNRVGGTAPGEGNVISGNTGSGVSITGVAATGNVVQGNLIGTDVNGTIVLGNRILGLAITHASRNTIGGGTPGAGNVIAGNALSGVSIVGSPTNTAVNNAVQGNFIGTDRTATLNLGNGFHGIYLQDSSNNAIGGTIAAERNVIAFNGQNGAIIVQTNGQATSNSIIGNSIFANALLGINLGVGDGVTPNDVGDRDAGPNDLQNFPTLSSIVVRQGTTTIRGKLNSAPGTPLRIEFFANDVADASGHGEGQTMIGSVAVTTNRRGIASFSAKLPLIVPAGQFITATATDPQNNTSEFSRAKQVVIQAMGDRGEIEPRRERSSPRTTPFDRAEVSRVEAIDTVLNQLVRRRRRGDPAADRLLV